MLRYEKLAIAGKHNTCRSASLWLKHDYARVRKICGTLHLLCLSLACSRLKRRCAGFKGVGVIKDALVTRFQFCTKFRQKVTKQEPQRQQAALAFLRIPGASLPDLFQVEAGVAAAARQIVVPTDGVRQGFLQIHAIGF